MAMAEAGPPRLTGCDRVALLQLARATIEGRLGVPDACEPSPVPAFGQHAGAFVTVHVGRRLRGCIGLTEARQPLADAVRHCAAGAAFGDPRFRPVSLTELPALSLEISVLSVAEPVAGVDQIEVGRHGLLIEHGWRRGLLLPQVAVARRWTAEEFLRQTCVKAGLPCTAWQRGARVFCFEADVFGE